jgi:formylglycine-generating enzyme required for sulfatase activity
MSLARRALFATLACLAITAAACNLVTGASSYSDGDRCTGPACGKCAAGQIVDPASGNCAACASGSAACGTVCCAPGHACQDAARAECATCATGETACGSACCVAGQRCDVASGRCVQDCESGTTRCGLSCCGAGQRCDEGSSTCIADCAATGLKNCGKTCCGGVQICSDEKAGTCACDADAGAAGSVVCGSTCCGAPTPNCVTAAGQQRCSACTDAALECGASCCPPDQGCLDKTTGACGKPFGVAKRSCAGGLTCPVPDGKGGTEQADCCESIVVPGATFVMGLDGPDAKAGPKNDGQSYMATVSTYSLDRFEVTGARFRAFLKDYDALMASGGLPAGAGANAHVPGPNRTGWRTEWNARLPKKASDVSPCGYGDDAPATCIDWYTAFAFCAWDGGRLPTEAEWELAASNGSAENVFPWGDQDATDDLGVFQTYGCSATPPVGQCPQNLSPVGSKPAGANRLGHRDLIGNAAEWVMDDYVSYPYGCVGSCTDYAGPGVASYRVWRGGAYLQAPDKFHACAEARYFAQPEVPNALVGLRCARTP